MTRASAALVRWALVRGARVEEERRRAIGERRGVEEERRRDEEKRKKGQERSQRSARPARACRPVSTFPASQTGLPLVAKGKGTRRMMADRAKEMGARCAWLSSPRTSIHLSADGWILFFERQASLVARVKVAMSVYLMYVL